MPIEINTITILSRHSVSITFQNQYICKNKPDSLTNQGLPGVNIVKICFFKKMHKSFREKNQ